MLGKVAVEEAFILPRLKEDALIKYKDFAQETIEDHVNWLIDLDGPRVQQCDQYGIGLQLLSHVAPGPQAVKDKAAAEALATEINDYIYPRIKNRPDRFQALASLSMHDPAQAATELRRCVEQYGFKGAIINNYQLSGPDGEDYLYYDNTRYDVFWKACTDLDVPVYLHPSIPTGSHRKRFYEDRYWLLGPATSFANDVNVHALGMVINGVFDRNPTLKLVLGHLGERIVGDLWRIHHAFEQVSRPKGLNCKLTLRDYFARNIWVATSGFFSTTMLNYTIAEIGADRILFAVDFPFERNKQGCEWFDNAEMSTTDRVKIGRDNAKTLFKLGEYKDSESLDRLSVTWHD